MEPKNPLTGVEPKKKNPTDSSGEKKNPLTGVEQKTH